MVNVIALKKNSRVSSRPVLSRFLRNTSDLGARSFLLIEKPQKAILPNGISDIIKKRDEDGDLLASSRSSKGGVRGESWVIHLMVEALD